MKKAMMIASVAAAVSLGAVGGAAFAGSGSSNAPASSDVSARVLGGADVKKVRMAAVVEDGGAVLYGKGVKSVTNPDLGVYCIKPKARTNINVDRIVPAVTVEWNDSSGDALMAHWRQGIGNGCASNRITVQTVNGSDGSFDVDDGVAFAIVVP